MLDVVVLALLGLLLVAAAATVVAERLLTAIVTFGVYSLAMAMLWAAFRAPDVALTEAAVGAGVTTGLFLVVVFRVDAVASRRSLSVRPRAAVTAVAFVGALLWTVPGLPAVGDPTAPGFQRVAPTYLAETGGLGVKNVVTAILVYYRGFDTFGEVVVVFAAGVAVLVALEREVVP